MEIAVVLHDIRSVHNVGSMFRTADAAGVSKIYLCGITPAPFDRLKNIRADFAKVALGAHESVAWESVRRTSIAIARLKKEGYTILAVEQSAQSVPYNKISLARGARVALVMGNEVEGLSPALLRSADTVLEIPMAGKKE
jgi:tRNA G18 (ribose-2'-O)-methylase SpoU